MTHTEVILEFKKYILPHIDKTSFKYDDNQTSKLSEINLIKLQCLKLINSQNLNSFFSLEHVLSLKSHGQNNDFLKRLQLLDMLFSALHEAEKRKVWSFRHLTKEKVVNFNTSTLKIKLSAVKKAIIISDQSGNTNFSFFNHKRIKKSRKTRVKQLPTAEEKIYYSRKIPRAKIIYTPMRG